jgi:hypothetical protein
MVASKQAAMLPSADHSASPTGDRFAMTPERRAELFGRRGRRIKSGEECLVVGRMQCGVFLHPLRRLVSGVRRDGGFL